MAARFSNFEDENDNSELPLPTISGKDLGAGGKGRYSSSMEHKAQPGPVGASFDDFDSDWDSEASPGPQRSVSPLLPASNGSSNDHTRNNSQTFTRASQLSSGEENTTLNLRKSTDLDKRAADLGLDEGFGRDRKYPSYSPNGNAEPSQRNPTGLALKNFTSSDHETSTLDFGSRKESKPINRAHTEDEEFPHESTLPTMPQIQYEPFSVEPPSHYQNYLYLLKYIHGLKILSGIHLLYTVIAIIFKVWYLLGGLFIAPFGFFAVHKLNRKLILIWGVAFVADTLAEAIGALVYSSKPAEEGGGLAPTLVHMTIVLIRVGLAYLIYRFWTKLPENAAEYFALFTSSPEVDRADVV